MADSQDTRDTQDAELVYDWHEALATGRNALPVRAVQIETSSICNFRCPSCPLSLPDYQRPEKHMPRADFRRILDAFPSLQKVELQGIGEVFLNPHIFELIEEAVARGLVVHTFSNASLLEPELADKVAGSGLAHINLSMDGADEATFRKLRKGGTLERFLSGARNLVEARARRGPQMEQGTPTIGLMCVLSKRNFTQVPEMIAIAEQLGVDSIILTKINACAKPELEEILLGAEERRWIASLAPHQGRVQVIHAWEPWTLTERSECYWPKHMCYVTIEGDVTPCCNYYDGSQLKLGNVFESTGEEIWNGEAYRAFRRQLSAGDLHPVCQKC